MGNNLTQYDDTDDPIETLDELDQEALGSMPEVDDIVEDAVVQPLDKPPRTAAEWLRDMRVSPDVTQQTTGVATDRITPALLMATSGKLLRISRREEEPDQKDSLEFQRFYGPAEYFAEHILRDSNKVGRDLLWKATNKGNLDFMQPGSVEKHISDVFYNSKLAQMVDGSSPLETIDSAARTTRIGEGGVGSMDQAPDEMRTVQASYFGFIDPVRTPEGARVGLDSYMTKNVMKGSDGKLYAKFINARTGKEELLDSVTAARKVIASGETRDATTKSVFALGGKSGIRVVPKGDIDYYLARADDAYSTAANMVTMPSAVKEMRLLMGSKYPIQAVSIDNREAPLVRTLDEATGKDMQTVVGKFLGARFAPSGGTVTAVRKDRIDVIYDSGEKGSVALYNNFPMNSKGYINNTPSVKAGQTFKEGDLMASSNYTDDKGVAAIGTNLRTGWLSWKGGTFEDAIVLSESGAKKLTSTTMYKTDIDLDKTVKLGRDLYKTWKPAEYTKEQIDALDDDGVIKPGSVLHKGDPMILAVQVTAPSPGTMGKRILSDKSQTWEHNYPGVVTDVVKPRKAVRVFATVTAPAEVGDKLAGNHGNKGVISQIIPDAEMPHNEAGEVLDMLFSPLGLITRCYDESTEFLTEAGWKFGRDIQTGDMFYCFDKETNRWAWGAQLEPMHCAYYTGNMHGAHSGTVDFLVTPGHKVCVHGIHKDDVLRETIVDTLVGKQARIPATAARMVEPYATPYIYETQDDEVSVAPGDWAGFLACCVSMGKIQNITYTHGNASKNRPSLVLDMASVGADSVIAGDLCAMMDEQGIEYVRDGYRMLLLLTTDAVTTIMAEVLYDYTLPAWLFEQPTEVLRRFIVIIERVLSKQTSPQLDSHGSGKVKVLHVRNKHLADQLQMIYAMLNVATVLRSDNRLQPEVGGCTLTVLNTDTHAVSSTMWYDFGYDGYIYCPTVLTGYIMTRRHGKVICMGNTNGSQIHEALLGKIARKTGVTEVMPAFYNGDIYKYVSDKLKQNHVKASEDLIDPETGRKIPDILTGVSHIYKLKHLAESKMSARGTDVYTAEGLPGGSGLTGCFPARQMVRTEDGVMSIADICKSSYGRRVDTFTGRKWCYKTVSDWFVHVSPIENILHIRIEYKATHNIQGAEHCTAGLYSSSIYPTRNHMMYRDDMSECLAGNLRVGDKLASCGPDIPIGCGMLSFDGSTSVAGVVPATIVSIEAYIPEDDEVDANDCVPVYDFTVDDVHRYTLECGVLCSNSKRFGSLEQTAMVAHGAFENLLDAKLLRGQSNSEFWRQLRSGEIPTIPGEPVIHKKFFAHLTGAGINIRRTQKGVSALSLSEDDVKELAGARELKTRDTYEAKNFRPMDGGLFGQDVFGPKGESWGYIQLDEPLPNPVMEEPIARLLRMPVKELQKIAAGKGETEGLKTAADLKQRLSRINLAAESAKAQQEFKDATQSKKDAALKRYVSIEQMRQAEVSPDKYILSRIPVLPPAYRPITSYNGLNMVADSNYLYAQMLDSRNDLRDARDLPEEFQQEARENLYNSWQELTGMHDTVNKKLQSKNVKGLLQWALGSNPKSSAFQRKVLSVAVDTVGRGSVVPNPRLKLNQVGVPEDMAYGIFSPFIARELTKRGYTPVDALKMVKERTPQTKDILMETMKKRPVLLNRAPSLHRFSIMAFDPVLVNGSAVHVHPSIVVPFNMDFDGDNANVHVPISDAAVKEARTKMFPERNLIAVKNREILYRPEKEYMQGLYIATRMKQTPGAKPKTYASMQEARAAYRDGLIDVDTPIILQNQ